MAEMSNLDPDLPLVERAKSGDFAAFEELVGRFQQRVFGLAFRMLGHREDAEDVVQKCMLSLVEHLDDFRGESLVSTWILRIAANHALKVLRGRKAKSTVPLKLPGDEDSYASLPHPEFIAEWKYDPAELAENREAKELAEAAVRELDDKHRSVFVLRDVEGLSVRETAEALGISESNVKVRLLRARLKLRERLTRAWGDESKRLVPDHSHEH
jgi:RNA polymerase sigma-70 factor (ECF subfamily)